MFSVDGAPSPRAILRGHKSQIHAAVFIRGNERLLTGDADGFVVAWDLGIMRPRAVWKAHEKPILGLSGWDDDKVITHGRDHKLIAWKLDADGEAHLSVAPPLEQVPVSRPQPWMLHELHVNTLNFCPFASCATNAADREDAAASSSELLVAVPNAIVSDSVDIFHLPSQKRTHTVPSGANHGMPMSLALFHHGDYLTLVSAFENGLATVSRLGDGPGGSWTTTYRAQTHAQPILSLGVAPDLGHFFTSGADAIVAKHPIPEHPLVLAAKSGSRSDGVEEVVVREHEAITLPSKVARTKHAGQQSICVRSDGRILATAGWDAAVRVYSAKSLKELAVLKWHQVGCYAVCFSQLPGVAAEVEAQAASGEENAQVVAAGERGGQVSVRDRRINEAKTAHWIAAGSKDGKVSLWDIY